MFGKITEREKQLATKIKMLEEENNILRNQNSFMAESSKRWARKFKDPRYSVPAKVIQKMEDESEQYKQRARAERDGLKARVAVLTNRVLQLTQEKASDLFGSATGNRDVSYEFAASHVDAKLTQQDSALVDLQLSRAWSEKMQSFAM
jgi:cell division septum initiation protein DivIVA